MPRGELLPIPTIQEGATDIFTRAEGSLLVMGGVDLATVKELLGHKDFKMTLRHAHLAPAHKIAALGVLDGQLNGKGSVNYTKTIQSNEKEVRAIALTS